MVITTPHITARQPKNGEENEMFELWQQVNMDVVEAISNLGYSPSLVDHADAWCTALGIFDGEQSYHDHERHETAEQFLTIWAKTARYYAMTDSMNLSGFVRRSRQPHPYNCDEGFRNIVDRLHVMMQNTDRGQRLLHTIGSLDTIPFQLPRAYFWIDDNHVTIHASLQTPPAGLSEEAKITLAQAISAIIECFGQNVVDETIPEWYKQLQ